MSPLYLLSMAVDLILALQALEEQGEADSANGDAIRDVLDPILGRLTPAEHAFVQGFSESLMQLREQCDG